MGNVEVLVACMNQKDFAKIKEMNIQSDVVLANQCDRTSYEEYIFDGHTAKMISTATRGVGVNRNFALAYASADICLLADDDVVYNDGYVKTVSDFYQLHPDADVVIFNFKVSRDGSDFKDIITETKKLKKRALSFGTYSVSIKKSAIDWNNIHFTHLFGGGTKYSCGEDTIFLNDCYKKKLNIYTCSDTIGYVEHSDSSWYNGYTEKYFEDKGVLMYALMGKMAVPSAVYHCLKHRKKYKAFGLRKAFECMKQGIRNCKAGN